MRVASTYSIAIIPGDGIGPEVMATALDVLRHSTRDSKLLDFTFYSLGATHYLETGEVLSDLTLEKLKGHDAILLGAVGGDPRDPRLKDGIIERGLLLELRFALDHYVNLRPTRSIPGNISPLVEPGVIDFLVVREGTEGPYLGNGGSMRAGSPEEIATEVSVTTAFGVSRVVRFAFEKATVRRKKLTVVHKSNVLRYAGGLWMRLVGELESEFPDVQVEYLHVDAATIFMVSEPSRFDVIVTDNLFGDILTDLAAAISGGIGLAASGNLNPSRRFPSMFEPVHGSAPDIAGKGVADPSAAILSSAMMMDFLGHPDIAESISEAVAEVALTRSATKLSMSTEQIGAEVIRVLDATV